MMQEITTLEAQRLALAETANGSGTIGYDDMVNSSFRSAGLVFPERWYRRAWDLWRSAPAYQPDSRGSDTARTAVARWYGNGSTVLPDNVVLTAGSSVSYHLLFSVLRNRGARHVALPLPGYPLFEELAGAAGLETQFYRCRSGTTRGPSFIPDLEELQAAVCGSTQGNQPPPGALVLITPNNPTGAVYPPELLSAAQDLCRKHGVFLIIDEVFSPFQETLTPGKRPEGALLLNGLSKVCGAPEVKAGWIACPGATSREQELLAEAALLHDTYLTLSGYSEAAVQVFLSNDARADREHLAREVVSRRRLMAEHLSAIPGVTCAGDTGAGVGVGVGGIHLCISLDANRCAEQFATVDDEGVAIALLRDHRLYLHPGYLYGLEPEGAVDPWFVVTGLHSREAAHAMVTRLAAALNP